MRIYEIRFEDVQNIRAAMSRSELAYLLKVLRAREEVDCEVPQRRDVEETFYGAFEAPRTRKNLALSANRVGPAALPPVSGPPALPSAGGTQGARAAAAGER